MTVQHLGKYKTAPDGVLRDAYAVWVDNPNQGIAQQMPTTFECEVCAIDMDLTRFKDMGALQTTAVRQVSLNCSNCATQYHWDSTPELERAGLTWTASFIPE